MYIIINHSHLLDFIHVYYCTLCTIAINKVSGVKLECEPMDMINQCDVMWNVSNFQCIIFNM